MRPAACCLLPLAKDLAIVTEPDRTLRWTEPTATRLLISELRVEGFHGVREDERTSGNEFSIDIEIQGDFGRAIATDRIEETVDIDDVVALVRQVNRQHQYYLIESFADAIGRNLLQRFPTLSAVVVRVTKRSLPQLACIASWTAEVVNRRA